MAPPSAARARPRGSPRRDRPPSGAAVSRKRRTRRKTVCGRERDRGLERQEDADRVLLADAGRKQGERQEVVARLAVKAPERRGVEAQHRGELRPERAAGRRPLASRTSARSPARRRCGSRVRAALAIGSTPARIAARRASARRKIERRAMRRPEGRRDREAPRRAPDGYAPASTISARASCPRRRDAGCGRARDRPRRRRARRAPRPRPRSSPRRAAQEDRKVAAVAASPPRSSARSRPAPAR